MGIIIVPLEQSTDACCDDGDGCRSAEDTCEGLQINLEHLFLASF